MLLVTPVSPLLVRLKTSAVKKTECIMLHNIETAVTEGKGGREGGKTHKQF